MTTNTPATGDRFPWEDDAATPAAGKDVQGSLWQSEEPQPNAPENREQADDLDVLDEVAGQIVGRERHVANKEYYSISEVCELVGLKPHVLRYWETQFQVLNPSKNRSGNRVYQRKEIRLILLVKHLLYEEKYTVEGAKQKIDQLRRGGKLREATMRALDSETLTLLRADLRQLLKLLTPPAG